MKSKKSKLIVFILLIILLMPIGTFANTLALKISTDKQEIRKGEEIKVKVSWDNKMQAADFSLNYNPKKLEYIESDIDEVFINNDTKEGKVKTAWVSMDNTDKTQIEYTFRVKRSGKINLKTTTEGGFATGNLEIPNKYEDGELIIKIPRNYTIICIIALVIIFIIVFLKIKGGKKLIKNKIR